MPQQDMSKHLGSSPSKVANSVIQNSKDGQKPVAVPSVVNTNQYNKQPVKVPVGK